MLRQVYQILVLSAAIFLSVVSGNEDGTQCGMYIAISSTSTVDDTKWGLYAGKDFEKNMPLGYPDIAINIINLQGNSHLSDENDASGILVAQTVEFFEQFIWVPIPSGGQFEMEEGRTVTAIPGAGVLGGFNPKLTNADWNHTSAFFRPALGEQRTVNHPGRGAFTPFFNVALRTKDQIQAGREIFLDYGDNWEEDAKEEDLTTDDYKKLDATVDKMASFFDKYRDELDEKAKTDIYDFLIRDVMGAAAGSAKGRKIVDILPAFPESLAKVKDSGGALAYSQPKSVRSLQWLESHGRCIDNIRPGASTIPSAGRGAFATRMIKAGGLVSPVPLVHLPAKSIVNMHELGLSEEESEEGPVYFRLSDEVQGQQLLLNYCYGHPQSSMLFFPAGSVSSLINHSKEPNSKMVWSNHPAHQRHWYDLEPKELLAEESLHLGLLMEIVAVSDIDEGEEITIDYGIEWSEAWEAHVKQWEEMVAAGEISKDWPLRALDLNEEYREKIFKNPEELVEEPYPGNVMLKCFIQVSGATSTEKIDGKLVREWADPPNGVFDSDNLEDCVVTEYELLEDGGVPGFMPYNYTVLLAKEHQVSIVKNVPQHAFVFIDKPGTGDHFVKNPFRHYIAVPDDIFPQGPWRDLAREH